jgi:hypothetical protein
VQLVRGDRAGALDTHLLLLELGEQIKHGGMIHQLVGIAIQNYAFSGLVNSPLAADLGLPNVGPSKYDAHRQAWQSEAKASRQPTEPDWAAAAGRLQRLRTRLVPFREAMEMEREFGLNTAYEVLSSPTPDKVFGDLMGTREGVPYGLLLRAGLVNRRRTFREVATAYEKVIECNWSDRELKLAYKHNTLLGLLMLSPEPPRFKVTLAHTMLALLEMQCRAAAGEKGSLLPDPFAPGQPLRERKGVFYSVGADGQDNGGRPLSPKEIHRSDARGDVSLLSWYKPSSPPAAQAP